MKKIAGLVVVGLALIACGDPNTARTALTRQGYTDIEITGWKWLGCGRDDVSAIGFKAKSIAGYEVSGVVCTGVFKGSTIRTWE